MYLKREVPFGDQPITLETGKMAKQADGAIVTRWGDTVLLTTACRKINEVPKPFLPLTVDYRESSSAGGRIPGGFFKREGRPTEKEIITCRMIDRPLRPLFPKGYFDETQIVSMVLSADGEHDPDTLAINSASAALAVSDMPFYNPVGAVRVGLVEDELVFNPVNSLRDISDLDLIVVGTEEAIVMVEAAANQLPESLVLDAIFQAHERVQDIIRAQHELYREGGFAKPQWQDPEVNEELLHTMRTELKPRLAEALRVRGKFEQKDAVSNVVPEFVDQLAGEDEELRRQASEMIYELENEILRDEVLGQGVRLDGRAKDEIRPIHIDVGLLPRTHGSALFTRGETQALVTSTLGTRRDAQIIEEYEGESVQKFLLHYNFPPFSVGEVRFLRGPGRREIGHGVLARRSLLPVLPHEDDFAYTVRVVSDILESNGSSSMATVCGASLALFDAGIPMLAPVAGVAMGLIKDGDNFAVLSDIAGQEDHHGDMDFKVAGTRDGITALQMDIKIGGISREILETALIQARAGRFHILDKMADVLGEPRSEIAQHAPRIFTMMIPSEKIRDVIGPGGKTIRSITAETGAQIEIEDDGQVTIAAPDQLSHDRARSIIESLTEVPELGKVYTGQVRRVENYGAFVEIIPGTDGLLHISEIDHGHVNEVSDVLREGDEVEVKVIQIDENNRIRLSRKELLPRPEGIEDEPRRERSDRDRGGRREGGRQDRGDRGGRGRRRERSRY